VAAVLGLAGFYVAYLWSRRDGAEARLPAFGLGWVEATAAAGRGLATEVATLHNGRLGTYVLTSVVGVALVLLLARTLVPR
jgi:hypothetical protein